MNELSLRVTKPAVSEVEGCPSWLISRRAVPLIRLLLAIVVLTVPCFAQGRVDCNVLNSKVLHRKVRYCVMLPPSYQTDANKKYPALYFLHGLGENEQALLRSGGWDLIEDLSQQHKIGDFLIISPEGGHSFFINSADGRDPYGDFLLSEFIPYIESHYRIIHDRRARGVTGLSMGGYGALRLAFAHPELFSSVSAQSPALMTDTPQQLNAELRDAGPLVQLMGGVFGNPISLAHWRENDPFDLARRKRIQINSEAIYFNCGESDEYGFAEGASKLHKQLLSEGIRHEFHLYPGGHNAEYFLSHLGETIEFHSRAFAAAKLKMK